MEEVQQDVHLEISWQRYLKSNNDILGKVRNHLIHGAISKENPNISTVYTSNLLRVCDLRKNENHLQQLLYNGGKQLVHSSIDNGYIVNIVEDSRNHQYSEIEDNILEIREFQSGSLVLTNLCQIEIPNEVNGRTMDVKDVFLLQSNEVAINLEHRVLAFIRLEDIRSQGRLLINYTLNEVRFLKVRNEDDAFKVFNVDLYQTQLEGEKLLVTKTSLSEDNSHSIDVYDSISLKNLKEIQIIPQIEQKIKYQMNSEFFENAQDYQESLEPELTGPQSLMNPRKYYRVIDVYSSPVGFFVLIQEQYLLILFRLDHIDGIEINQINSSLQQASTKIVKEMIDCKINRTMIQAKADNSLNIPITLLSASGTLMVGLEINSQITSKSIYIAELSKESMTNTRELSLRLYGNLQMAVSDSEIIISDLMDIGQYRKLAEFVLLKDIRSQKNIFDAIGLLRDYLQNKLNQMKEIEIVRILQRVKAYQGAQVPTSEQAFRQLQDFKRQTESLIGENLLQLEGIQLVFNAILKRQIEQAKLIQLNIQSSRARTIDEEDINNIKNFLLENVDKQYNFLKAILFLVQTGFLNYAFQDQFKLREMYKFRFPESYQGPRFINELLQFAPQLIPKLPLIDAEDYITLFDSSVIPQKSLSVLYYHILDLNSCSTNIDLVPQFNYVLENTLSESESSTIRGMHALDDLSSFAFLNQQDAYFKGKWIVSQLAVNSFKELSPQILRKLVMAQQWHSAMIFINSRSATYLVKERSSLLDTLDAFLNCNKEREFFQFLREHENIIQREHYEECISTIIDEIVKRNKIVEALFTDSHSQTQDEMISIYLKAKYQDLEFSYQIWKRNMIQGVGYGLQLNHQAQASVPRQVPSNQLRKSIVFQYTASLNEEQKNSSLQQSVKGSGVSMYEFKQDLADYQKLQEVDLRLKGAQKTGVVKEQKFDQPQIDNQLADLKTQFLVDPFFAKKKQAQTKPQNLLTYFRKQNNDEMEVDTFQNIQEPTQFTRLQRKGLGLESQVNNEFVYQENNKEGFRPKQTKLFPNALNLVNYDIHQELRRSMGSSPQRNNQHYQSQQDLMASYSPNNLMNTQLSEQQQNLKYSNLFQRPEQQEDGQSDAYYAGYDLRQEEIGEIEDPIMEDEDQQMMESPQQEGFVVEQYQESFVQSKQTLSMIKESAGEDVISEGYEESQDMAFRRSSVSVRARGSEDVQRSISEPLHTQVIKEEKEHRGGDSEY